MARMGDMCALSLRRRSRRQAAAWRSHRVTSMKNISRATKYGASGGGGRHIRQRAISAHRWRIGSVVALAYRRRGGFASSQNAATRVRRGGGGHQRMLRGSVLCLLRTRCWRKYRRGTFNQTSLIRRGAARRSTARAALRIAGGGVTYKRRTRGRLPRHLCCNMNAALLRCC